MTNTTTIIGAGPAGLLQALYMLQRGHNVTILERRLEYKARENSVFLQAALVKMLLQDLTQFYQCGYDIDYEFGASAFKVYITYDINKQLKFVKSAQSQNRSVPELDEIDRIFIQKIKSHLGNIAIDDFQNYLENKAITAAQKANLTFEILSGVEVYDIKTGINLIFYKNSRGECFNQKFDNLVICSGPNFDAATKILSANASQEVRTADFLRCAHAVGFVYYTGNDKQLLERLFNNNPIISPFIPLATKTRKRDLRIYKELGWQHADLPKFYIIVQPDAQRFYFTCEIPATWQTQVDKANADNFELKLQLQQNLNEQVAKWIKQTISIEYEISNLNDLRLECDPSKPTKLQTFMKTTKKLKSAYLINANANVFFAGDVLFNSVYKLGIGHYFAALAAKAVADCFDHKSGAFKNLAPLNKIMSVIQSEYDRILQLYIIVNYMSKNPIRTKYVYEPLRLFNSNLCWMYKKVMQSHIKNVTDIDRQTIIKKLNH